jgi:hypothetical protein
MTFTDVTGVLHRRRGEAMPCVVETVIRQTDASSLLEDMRSWLDHYGFNTRRLTISRKTSSLALITVMFRDAKLAGAFASMFGGAAVHIAFVILEG